MEHTKTYQEFQKNGNTKLVRYSEGAEALVACVPKAMILTYFYPGVTVEKMSSYRQNNKKGMNYTLFKACRQFYKVYPQIGSTVSSQFKLPDFGKSSTVSNEFVTDPDVLVNNLSFSHIREIMVLNDAFERFFYETECMKCNWNG